MKNQGANVSDNLRRLLFEKNLTPTDLARKIDIPQQTIQRIIKNKIKRPHEKTLKSIANYFNLDVAELVGDSRAIFVENTAIAPDNGNVTIPVYTWPQLEDMYLNNVSNPIRRIFVSATYSDKAYGVIMNDSSMNPYFMKDTVLILEQSEELKDRAFILVYLTQSKKILFRQLLSDGENYFLKALTPALTSISK